MSASEKNVKGNHQDSFLLVPIMKFYEKFVFLSQSLKFLYPKHAGVLQRRRMIGHFNLSKVNFTECWFQVKVYLKAEMLQLCISLLLAYSLHIGFFRKKEGTKWKSFRWWSFSSWSLGVLGSFWEVLSSRVIDSS